MVEGLIENGTISGEDQLRLHVKLQTEAITHMNETVQRQAQLIGSLLMIILAIVLVFGGALIFLTT